MNANPKMSDHDNDESESSLESVQEPKHQDVQVAKEVENKNEEQVSEESYGDEEMDNQQPEQDKVSDAQI